MVKIRKAATIITVVVMNGSLVWLLYRYGWHGLLMFGKYFIEWFMILTVIGINIGVVRKIKNKKKNETTNKI